MKAQKQMFSSVIFLLTAISICFGGYSQEVLQDEPVAWWRFDDYIYKDGYPLSEDTGNISSSTFEGDAMIAPAGIDGGSGWFNGNKALINIGNDLGSFLHGSSAITFEAWVRVSVLPETNLHQRIFGTRIDLAKAGLDVSVFTRSGEPPVIRVGARSHTTDPYLVSSAPFSITEQWAHIVCIADFTNKKVLYYVNGELIGQPSVNFVSDVYVYGSPTQHDHIGRAPDGSVPYRGYLDEVAVYNKALSPSRIQAHYLAANPQEPLPLWDSIINDDGSADGPFLGSPSIHKFDDGTMIATNDYFGSNKPVPTGTSVTKISYNNGISWWNRANIVGVVMASLFEHNGAIYSFGISRNPGHITIAKSTNFGASWTTPTDSENGLLFEADDEGQIGYHTAPVPVLFANGRIYRVFEFRSRVANWPTAYEAVMVSADVNSDLLNSDSWVISNTVAFEPEWAQDWGSTRPGWLEGNAVEAPDGTIYAIMRINSDPAVGKAAILTLSEDGKTLSFDPQTGFIDMPGGRDKFHINRDPVTGKYLTLNNNNTDIRRPQQRNTLSLIASDDLRNWQHIRTIIQDNSPMTWFDSMVYTGFQYVSWQFDGDDIIFISRTAYDGANNFHDANKVTFHRIENYLDFVAPCGEWGYLSKDLNLDCSVGIDDLMIFAKSWLDDYDILDFAQLNSEWLKCTLPFRDGCINLTD